MPGGAAFSLPYVVIVVPVRNGQETIVQCIEALLGLDYPAERTEILVVDNGSTDATAALIGRFPVRHVRESAPGAASARNRGILESRSDIVAFIDADCIATRGWLRELVRCFEDDAVAGAAGEIFAFPPRTAAERYMASQHPYCQLRALSGSWPFAATGNVAFRRSVFEAIGDFDARLVSAEDKDFGRRFFEAELGALRYCARAVVFHHYHRTARRFFKQQVHWIHGAALLHAKYGLPWGIREELGKYRTLLAAGGALAGSAVRRAVHAASRSDFENAYYRFLRELAFRLGGARWLLQRRRLRAPFLMGGSAV